MIAGTRSSGCASAPTTRSSMMATATFGKGSNRHSACLRTRHRLAARTDRARWRAVRALRLRRSDRHGARGGPQAAQRSAPVRNLASVDLRGCGRPPRRGGVRRRVNFAGLDVEELGSVYESLLDYHPEVKIDGERSKFELIAGSERKSTGSYYTPPELVRELIKSALEPVIEDRLAKAATASG